MSRLILGMGLWFTATAAFADYGMTFQKPVTPIAHKILELHNLIIIICLIIFLIVFSFMFYSLFAHRKSRGYKPAKFHDNTTIEVVWTVIPFLILVSMAIPSTATLIDMSDVSNSDLTVKITGYQWKWQYTYPGQDISFFSTLTTPQDEIDNKAKKDEHYLLEVDNPLVLPIGKKVRFQVTGNDVIHSWWVPQLGVKKDAIPGFVNEFWARVDEPGTYRGQCAELCGKGHGFMPIVVQAVSQEDFTKWVAMEKKKAADGQGPKVLCLDLRRLSRPRGQGHPGRVPGAGRQQDRHRTPRRAHQDRIAWQAHRQVQRADAGLRGPAERRGCRRDHHFRAQQFRQQDR